MNELLMFQFNSTVSGINKIFTCRSFNNVGMVTLCDMCLSFSADNPNMEFVHKDRFHITRDIIRRGGLEQLMGRVFVQLKNHTPNLFTTWEVSDMIRFKSPNLEGSRMIEVNLDIIPHHLRFDTLVALCNL